MPAGRFRIGRPIDLTNRRAIQFQGVSGGGGSEHGTRVAVEKPNMNAFEMDLSKGIIFRDLHLIRPQEIRSDPGDGFHALNQTSDCRFIDCTVTFFHHGAFLQNSFQNYFRGCLLEFCEIGAKVDVDGGQSNDTKFQECLFGQCNVYELEINANTVYAVGCDFESSRSEWGIFGRFGQDCVIANCSFIRGIMLGLERARVIGSGLVGSKTHGIVVSRAHNAVISNNVIRNSGGHGIKFFEANDVLIEGNQILASGFDSGPFFSGIVVQDSSNRANIRQNIVRRQGVSTLHAVTTQAGVSGTAIVSNDFRDGFTASAINDSGAGTIAVDNLT